MSESDALAAILFQICGPAHISWQDTRWQELLHAYGVWIHVEARLPVLEQATKSLVLNAAQSSNLAALCWHVTRLTSDLLPPPQQTLSDGATTNTNTSNSHADFSNRIAMVAKARATAGSLNLLRLLVHSVIQYSTTMHADSAAAYLTQVFTYKSRDHSNREFVVASDLVQALITFLVQLHESELLTGSSSSTLPELYDVTTCVLQLLLVLCSSQLYSPMESSWQRSTTKQLHVGSTGHYWWDLVWLQARENANSSWTPRQLLAALLEWTMHRPPAPERSVQHHLQQLCQSVAQATPHKVGDDGMYDTHVVVMAQAPVNNALQQQDGLHDSSSVVTTYHPQQLLDTHRHNYLYDATKGVVRLSSTILLLPLRLLSLAFHLFQKDTGSKAEYDQHWRRQQQQRQEQLTRDVMWLTTSPIADLSSCLILLLSNNERQSIAIGGGGDTKDGRATASDNGSTTSHTHTQQPSSNPFRDELARLTDNRWQVDGNGLPDLPNLLAVVGDQNDEFADSARPLLVDIGDQDPPGRVAQRGPSQAVFSVNFEALFKSFGQTAHTEVGALLLYTLMQSSRSFADSIAVRSDLDTLVLPLLRTLYIASSLKHYTALDYATNGKQQRDGTRSDAFSSNNTQQVVSIRSCPFRSLSQLYVIIILLLLFSQDLSFGSDAFRRVMVASVPWYKERNIKDISLGSVLVLCLLRSLTFNLNRLHDAFLLSNCCAILMNLSTSVSDLHEYAALRLASVTLSSMKRYATLKQENPNIDEEDLDNPTAMHGEVCRTLLRVVKECFATKTIERNLHLVYAMVYHQVEFKKLVAAQGTVSLKGTALVSSRFVVLKLTNVLHSNHRRAILERRRRPHPKGYSCSIRVTRGRKCSHSCESAQGAV